MSLRHLSWTTEEETDAQGNGASVRVLWERKSVGETSVYTTLSSQEEHLLPNTQTTWKIPNASYGYQSQAALSSRLNYV